MKIFVAIVAISAVCLGCVVGSEENLEESKSEIISKKPINFPPERRILHPIFYKSPIPFDDCEMQIDQIQLKNPCDTIKDSREVLYKCKNNPLSLKGIIEFSTFPITRSYYGNYCKEVESSEFSKEDGYFCCCYMNKDTNSCVDTVPSFIFEE